MRMFIHVMVKLKATISTLNTGDYDDVTMFELLNDMAVQYDACIRYAHGDTIMIKAVDMVMDTVDMGMGEDYDRMVRQQVGP